MKKNKVFLDVEISKSMIKVCIGVHEAWGDTHIRKETRGYSGGRKHLCGYFIDENGKFTRERITKTEAIKLKLHGIWKQRKFVCKICSCKFLGLVKNDKDVPECPNCK